MGLIVQKFGGTSVADAERIQNVCRIIAAAYDRGESVVAVLSAQGDTTDELLRKAIEINPNHSARERDVLLSAGEQISVALAAMCLERMGYPVISLTGWQAGIRTDAVHSEARILDIAADKILAELRGRRIVLVAGFQGVDNRGNITTLGRGGSDTSAVALAACLCADRCQIFTDVDGVYTADPRKDASARKIDQIDYDSMLCLIENGAQVLHDRCVATAKEFGVVLEVLSSFTGNPGTIVNEKKSKRSA